MGKKAKDASTRRGRRDKQKNERREQEAAAREAAAARQRRMRMLGIAVPVVTLALSLTLWLAADLPRIAALAGLVGVAVWIPVLLGSLGSEIEPRDRTRAGSIDFGHRK